MQVFNRIQITSRWEQIFHNADILDNKEIKKYSEHYTVNSKS